MKTHTYALEGLVRTISLFPSDCKVGTGLYLPDIPIEEAHFVSKSCENPFDFNIITCKSPNAHAFINEVDGLKLDSRLTSPQLQLPLYFPTLDVDSIIAINKHLPDLFVAVTLKDITKKLTHRIAGGLREATEIQFISQDRIDALRAQSNKALFLTGSDTSIEFIWRERQSCDLFEILKKMNFSLIGGFNFSLYDGECSFSQVLNQKRSLYSSLLLYQNSLPAVPHIYATTKFQLTRWINWLLENPSHRLVTINCQLDKPIKQINDDVYIVSQLIQHIPDLEIILQGFPFDYIYKFGDAIGNLHFTDAVPLVQARNHHRLRPGNGFTKKLEKTNATFLSILIENIQQRILQIENIRAKIFWQK